MIYPLMQGSAAKSACPTWSGHAERVEAPTTQGLDDVRRSLLHYPLWPGDRSEPEHDFLENGDSPISLVTTHHGHELLAPYGLTITPVDRTRKTRLVYVTLHRADQDDSRELSVPAWQGDNGTLHLIFPLPDEDEILGPVKRTVFGAPRPQAEKRDYLLGKLYHGDSAILDIDISQVYTPGKALRA